MRCSSRRFVAFSAAALALIPLFGLVQAQPAQVKPAAPALAELRPEGITGSLVICGGGKLPDAIFARFMELAGGEKAKLVIIPTAGDAADKQDPEAVARPWRDRKAASVVVLHTRDRKRADDPAFVQPLKEATGVWISGGQQSRIADAYLGTAVERELHALLKRGGVIGGTSAGAAIQSRVMIAGGADQPQIATGFDFLPGSIIDQHFVARKRQPRLIKAVERHPGRFGVGIDEGTALVVQGRTMRVVGDSTVSVILGPSVQRTMRNDDLKAGQQADLTQLRRAAIARCQPRFPPLAPAEPVVKSGSLVIVGGGGMPPGLAARFIELAGGPDALIVVLPTAGETVPKIVGEVAMFQKAGATNVHALRARTKEEVEAPESLALLAKARGIWFGGGRQWRFVDAYENTKAMPLFHDCLKRGGVIGGSSAGASIQAEYLVRGHPLGNLEPMAEGYERGFNFLPGVAIDQHFAQRKRFADMTAVMKTFPQLLGIGLDETTAIVVKGHVAEILGRNKVHFYDHRLNAEEGKPDYVSLGDGEKYDLKARRVVK